MNLRARARLLTIAMTMTCAAAALAGDRHVYLDTNADGQLNDCPNPAHNAKGTSNTDELSFCSGGSQSGKVIGTATGRVSSSACSSGGGTVSALRNGSLADVDADGSAEPVYGHPQACVYFMAKSDSCDVHAGTYRKPGAQCTSNCGDFSRAGVSQGTCADWNCYLASVLAFGYGPNLDGTGYGTASAPGYLRGAKMGTSTDTWDSDGDKVPDNQAGEPTSYAPILSGDANGNGTFELTSCTGSSCSGDAFFAVQMGCGSLGSGSYGINCSNAFTGTETGSQIDSDANGSFDTEIGRQGSKEVHFLVVKDIKFTGYNGGNGSSVQTARYKEGHFNMGGDGSTNGLALDHIALSGNDYKGVAGQDETFWAAIADMKNAGCTAPKYTEIENSYIEQNNQMVFDNDGQVGARLGCAFNIHDNRFVVNVTSPRSGQGGPVNAPANILAYLKSIDTLDDGSPKVHRFWNNEVIYKNGGAGPTWFMDVQAFGNSQTAGLGEIWVYGNLFRNDPSVQNKPQFFFPIYCGTGTGSWRWYWFNNTFDGWSSGSSVDLQDVCNGTGGELYVGKNNVEVFATNEQTTTATTRRVANNLAVDGNRCATTSQYFDCGSNPTLATGPAFYRAKTGGGLDGTGSCDPDGDGVAGVDYDGNGTNDTAWTDLAGNAVSCTSPTAPLDIGAIQSSGGTSGTPPPTVQNLHRTDRP